MDRPRIFLNMIEIISSLFNCHGILGEIVHTTFQDFSQSRNEALVAAQNSAMEFDFILLNDADLELQVTSPDWATGLTGPAYNFVQKTHWGSSTTTCGWFTRTCPASTSA